MRFMGEIFVGQRVNAISIGQMIVAMTTTNPIIMNSELELKSINFRVFNNSLGDEVNLREQLKSSVCPQVVFTWYASQIKIRPRNHFRKAADLYNVQMHQKLKILRDKELLPALRSATSAFIISTIIAVRLAIGDITVDSFMSSLSFPFLLECSFTKSTLDDVLLMLKQLEEKVSIIFGLHELAIEKIIIFSVEDVTLKRRGYSNLLNNKICASMKENEKIMFLNENFSIDIKIIRKKIAILIRNLSSIPTPEFDYSVQAQEYQ
ncbi:hypothetical protein Bhyg_13375 [Pseudolycoriella hygida]|uniref:Uncharacterized protein n=1 Tax=Pseudolycoriella hygida TaxID=35572 RepID=A0A9Q0RWA2_9DIPT|nr:hypothetical protein Bhyg_13375 [Pseudolycoriella hygida]